MKSILISPLNSVCAPRCYANEGKVSAAGEVPDQPQRSQQRSSSKTTRKPAADPSKVTFVGFPAARKLSPAYRGYTITTGAKISSTETTDAKAVPIEAFVWGDPDTQQQEACK
jgi:hypothetical protein